MISFGWICSFASQAKEVRSRNEWSELNGFLKIAATA